MKPKNQLYSSTIVTALVSFLIGSFAISRPAGVWRRNGALIFLALAVVRPSAMAEPVSDHPDILFIAIDDMNDWTTLFDKNNPIQTPNLERLAERGTFFTRAYCASAACNPSRSAIMTGLMPSTSGIYNNGQDWKKQLPGVVTLAEFFKNHDYRTLAAGKIFHHGTIGDDRKDRPSFTEVFPLNHVFSGRKNPHVKTTKNNLAGVFTWGPLDKRIVDDFTTDWVVGKLTTDWQRPTFLAAGIFRPHLNHEVPTRFFDLYPLDQIKLPPRPGDDFADIPATGRQMAESHYLYTGYLFGSNPPPDDDPYSLKKMVQAYMASSTYADEKLGEILDALDATGRADETIIVLWSDHGYHLGDKNCAVKFTLWEKANHVPLIIVAPGITKPDSRVETPVSLVDLYPTLIELAGLPQKDGLDGKSLVPLLKDPQAHWTRPAIMTMEKGNHAVRTRDWRYIRYADGTRELYHDSDPWNLENLLYGDPEEKHLSIARELDTSIPQKAGSVPHK